MIAAGFGVLFASVVVVSVGFAFVSRVDRPDSWADHIPLVVSTGLAITVGTLVLLSLLSALHPMLLAGLLAVVVALVGLRLVVHVRRLASNRADTGMRRGGILAAIAAHVRPVLIPALLIVGTGAAQFAMTAGTRAPWRGFTPWYYWGASLQVAAAAGYPPSVVEWGTTVPFLGDYLPFNAAAAAFSFIISGERLVEMDAFRALILIVAVSGAYYALRRFFSTTLAALGVVLLFSSSLFLAKFASVRPESFGLGLAAWALWALDVGMVERRRRLLGIAAVLAALVAASHLAAFLLLAALALSVLNYRLLADGRLHAYTVSFSLTAAGAIVIAAGLSLAAQSIRGTTSFLAELFGSASGIVNNIDQTYLLYAYLPPKGLLGDPNAGPPSAVELINSRSITPWGSQVGMTAALLIGSSVLLALVALLGTRETRPIALIRAGLRLGAPLVVFLGVLVVFMLVSASAETFVPRRTGPSRIAPYIVVAYVFVPLGIASAARWIEPRRRAVLLTVLGLAVGAISLSSYAEARDLPPLRPTAAQLAEIQRAGARLTSDSGSRPLVLTNYYTEGLLPVLLDADGLLDGRIPYTNAPLRERALAILRDTAEFFQSGDCARTDSYGADFILISSKRNRIGHLGGYALGPGFAQIAHIAQPVFSGRSLRVFDYQEFCAAAETTP
jgi:hypothetical protein